MTGNDGGKFLDRVVELRRVPANELRNNPRNWRTHGDDQRKALSGVLESVGVVAAVIARETDDGELQILDGHLRADIAGDQPVPVLIVDVDAEEADAVLATFDPIGALAGVDAERMAELLADVTDIYGDESFADLLAELTEQADRALMAAAAAAQADEESGDENDDGDDAESGYTDFRVPLTIEQESDIRRAIDNAKKRWDLESSGDALHRALTYLLESDGEDPQETTD